jgi:hypothetical protein
MNKKADKVKLISSDEHSFLIWVGLSQNQSAYAAAVKARMTFYNTSNDPAMIELSPTLIA